MTPVPVVFAFAVRAARRTAARLRRSIAASAVLAGAAAAPVSLAAQQFEAAGRSDEAVAARVATRAFAGLSVHDSVLVKARLIVYQAIRDQKAIDFTAPDWQDVRERIIARRDSTLRTLVGTAQERARLDRNLKAL